MYPSISTIPSPRPKASNTKTKKPMFPSLTYLHTTLLFIFIFTIPALLFFNNPSSSTPSCAATTSKTTTKRWTGDLLTTQFAWNHLSFMDKEAPPASLKIAVFSRKWPDSAAPGGMERHALTLHTALAHRGHRVHVFTSPPQQDPATTTTHEGLTAPTGSSSGYPQLHFHDGPAGRWRHNDAWAQFEEENRREPFDAVHSESVALPHWIARNVSNLAVSWHGIALESLQSSIYQDLARRPNEPMSPSFKESMSGVVIKILNEIRFFHSYAHHVAISDSSGEMLRDVYQIPSGRVHVILNGVDEEEFAPDLKLGKEFRAQHGVPQNASLVMGVSGRLVKDKGHPLLHEAFSKLMVKYPHVYLIVAGAGPWKQRYKDLGSRVIALGAVSPAQLRSFYNSIDIFVNPTLRPQGLDLTLMEAMQCGKPILATRFPSIKGSIVVDDEFGHMFAPNVESLLEALEVVVKEGPERVAMRGRACREYASSMFTARKMALAYERLFLCIRDESFCKYPLR